MGDRSRASTATGLRLRCVEDARGRALRPLTRAPGSALDLLDLRQPLHPHAKLDKAWVAKRPAQTELVFLPSYSPELNPDEYLNRYLRELHPRATDKPGLKAQIRAFLHRRQKQPQIVRNYFKAPHAAYAASPGPVSRSR